MVSSRSSSAVFESDTFSHYCGFSFSIGKLSVAENATLPETEIDCHRPWLQFLFLNGEYILLQHELAAMLVLILFLVDKLVL
jgi:hypothetical protein